MKERPILFSTPMVRAILEGRKSQTRRIVKPQPIYDEDSGYVYIGNVVFDIHDKWDIPMYLKDNARWEIGDILWVRETWRPTMFSMPIGWPYDYRATAKEDGCPEEGPWKPSIFMPKEASRLKLKVTDIRVERVQDISEEDAMAEGVEYDYTIEDGRSYVNYTKNPKNGKKIAELETARASYMSLWDSINGILSFRQNPWVWVIEFEKL